MISLPPLEGDSPRGLAPPQTTGRARRRIPAKGPAAGAVFPGRLLLLAAALALLTACRPRGDSGEANAPTSGVRVVSLAPSLTEMIAAIGGQDRLVGRSSACDYPPEVLGVPVIGQFGAPSLEAVIARRPTLILDVDLAEPGLASKMEGLGLRRERIACARIAEIPQALRRLGVLLACEEKANQAASELSDRLAALRAESDAALHRPTVYIEIWNDPLMTVGNRSFVSELVALAGGRNLADDVDQDYFRVSAEWVVARNPEVMVCLSMNRNAQAAGLARRGAGWAALRAVTNHAVIDDLDPSVLLRPGPRVADGAEALRDRLRRVAGKGAR